MNWIKNLRGEYPKFWENYLECFESKTVLNPRYVIFDCKTTGLDFNKDRLLSIGAIAVENNQIIVEDFIEIFIKQDVFKNEISDVSNNEREEQFIEAEALIRFLGYVKNATLIGHQINFDIELLNQALEKLDLGNIKNQHMDISLMHQKINDLSTETLIGFDELCSIYKIKNKHNNRASENAYIIAVLFLKMKKKLNI